MGSSTEVSDRLSLYRRVFDTPDGRDVLADLEKVCQVRTPIISPEQVGAWNEAKKTGGHYNPPPVDVNALLIRNGMSAAYWYIQALLGKKENS